MLSLVPSPTRLFAPKLPVRSPNARRLKSILSSSPDCKMRDAVRRVARMVTLEKWATGEDVPAGGARRDLERATDGYLPFDLWKAGR